MDMTHPPPSRSEQDHVVIALERAEQGVDMDDVHILNGRVRDAIREVPVNAGPLIACDGAQKSGRNHQVEALFPWMRHLPEGDDLQFVDELVGTLDADPVEMMLVIEMWRRTAEVWATPEAAEVLSTPSDGDFGVVEDVALEAGYAALAVDQVDRVGEQWARRGRYIVRVDKAYGG